MGAPLNDWQFDPNTQELTVILPDGVTPNYFLLAEPARIVFNLPDTQLGPVLPAQYYSGPIQSIRVSQFDAESARVVVEFAPNTILDPRHAELSSNNLVGGTQWILRPLVVDSPAGTTVTLDPHRALPPNVSAAAPDTAVTGAAVTGAATLAPPHTANDGIRTDASPLINDGTSIPADQPPGTLPIDPFAATAVPQVSVPPLGDRAAPAAVTVPPLADRAAAPTTPAVTVPPADLPDIPSDRIEAPTETAPPVLAQAPLGLDADSAEGVPLTVTPAPDAEAVATFEPVTVPPPSPIRPAVPGAEPPRITTPAVSAAPAAPAAPSVAPPFLEGTATAANAAEPPLTIPPAPGISA
ncbi:MAG: AMIN domain-containing protein [Leptolyngbya sp. RL_3_1]|nr:AMIN domain-containing protein [Leptolyngbya sp. RL_3_1]